SLSSDPRPTIQDSRDRTIKTVALNRGPPRLDDDALEISLLCRHWRGAAGHVKNVLLLQRSMKIVDSVAQRDLSNFEPETDPVACQMIEVVQKEAADGKRPQILGARRFWNVRELGIVG